ncbi:MAG: hypothetical protein RIQ99_1951 [Pseudomonadota bacterium]|jgi:uncharacterized membrane protein YedE/YeeE
MKVLTALLSGLLFGMGLLVSGMSSPDKVIGFLNVTGAWDPSLAVVMGGALMVATPLFALANRRGTAWSGEAICAPRQQVIDRKLVGGAMLFGIGWAIAGLCPGPALVNLIARPVPVATFLAAMVIGLLLSRRD